MIDDTKDDYTYWFVRVKEVGSSVMYGEQVDDHQFKIIGGRDAAKQYCIDKYGDYPFRKPTNGAPDGTKYFYLMSSSLYWYDKAYKEYQMICSHCGKSYVQIGDTYKSKMWNVHRKSICSIECHIAYQQKLKDEYNTMNNENYWVSDSEHPLTDKTKKLVGYIYRITNKRTLNSYVGRTIKPPLFRWWQHLEVDGKFSESDLSELLFEVIEIVYFGDDPLDLIRYTKEDDKLNERERYYIDYYELVENGFNKI